MESFDVRWLEENGTDARVGPNWLFDYESLFKSFNVYSETVSYSCSRTSVVVEDEEEEVIYKPPLVTLESPQVNIAIPNNPLFHLIKEPVMMLMLLPFHLKKEKS